MYLHVLCGIPGSGKSTLAGCLQGYCVSTDSLRKYLWGNESVIEHDKLVFELAERTIRYLLGVGSNVIFDATNLSSKKRAGLVRLARENKSKVVLHLVDCPLEVALKRNRQRTRQVPEKIIISLFASFEYPAANEGFDIIKIYDRDKKLLKIIAHGLTLRKD